MSHFHAQPYLLLKSLFHLNNERLFEAFIHHPGFESNKESNWTGNEQKLISTEQIKEFLQKEENSDILFDFCLFLFGDYDRHLRDFSLSSEELQMRATYYLHLSTIFTCTDNFYWHLLNELPKSKRILDTWRHEIVCAVMNI